MNHRVQRYRAEWENRPECQQWLRPVPATDTRARCIACNSEFSARLQTILDHERSAHHQQRAARGGFDGYERERRIDRKVKTAMVKICAVFVEHNLAFLLADHLIPVLKEIGNDEDSAEVWRRLTMDRKLIQRIIKECLAVNERHILVEILQNSKFSIQYDETTDVAQIGNGCIVIKYLDHELQRIITALWEIIPIFHEYENGHDADAQHIYGIIRNSFLKDNVPLGNLVAFGSDGCHTMMGPNNSVAQRFSRDHPNIQIIKCPSHCLHLCAEYSTRRLPADVLKFCSSVHIFC